jgi:hypothetical protein
MSTKTLYLCAACRQKLRHNIQITELKGDGAPEKDTCAFCRRSCYGGWYEISYKEAAHD